MKLSPVLFLLAFTVLLSGCANSDKQADNSTAKVNADTVSSENSENSTTTNSKKSLDTSKAPSSPVSHLIDNFEIIGQEPELPTGCEITSLTMVLNYYDFDANKMTMATQYLPTSSYNVYYDGDRPMGNDLNKYFLGDPTTVWGYVCGTEAIVTAANDYFNDIGSKAKAKDLNGAAPDELYSLVSKDTPIVVWTTIEMADRNKTEGWYTENNEYVEWSTNDHCNVLIGYSDDTVTIADPIVGEVEYDKKQFEKVFASRGSKCVIVETNE